MSAGVAERPLVGCDLSITGCMGGTIDLRVFCGSSCLKMTRLLNTPIIGRLVASVDSSSIDMLAGLSKWPIRNMPPDFCAIAGPAASKTASSGPAVANAPRLRLISPFLSRLSLARLRMPRRRVPGLMECSAAAYLSSQMSSKREPLKMLLTISVTPFTRGCRQIAARM